MLYIPRHIAEYYPDGYEPDEEDICRNVCRHLGGGECVCVSDAYSWIERMPDVRQRGSYALVFFQHFSELCQRIEWHLSFDLVEHITNHLRHIAAEAWDAIMRMQYLLPGTHEEAPTPAPATTVDPNLVNAVKEAVLRELETKKSKPALWLPEENNYIRVLEWIAEQKQRGNDYLSESGQNRSAMCRRLSQVFGWTVDAHSLGAAMRRQ